MDEAFDRAARAFSLSFGPGDDPLRSRSTINSAVKAWCMPWYGQAAIRYVEAMIRIVVIDGMGGLTVRAYITGNARDHLGQGNLVIDVEALRPQPEPLAGQAAQLLPLSTEQQDALTLWMMEDAHRGSFTFPTDRRAVTVELSIRP